MDNYEKDSINIDELHRVFDETVDTINELREKCIDDYRTYQTQYLMEKKKNEQYRKMVATNKVLNPIVKSMSELDNLVSCETDAVKIKEILKGIIKNVDTSLSLVGVHMIMPNVGDVIDDDKANIYEFLPNCITTDDENLSGKIAEVASFGYYIDGNDENMMPAKVRLYKYEKKVEDAVDETTNDNNGDSVSEQTASACDNDGVDATSNTNPRPTWSNYSSEKTHIEEPVEVLHDVYADRCMFSEPFFIQLESSNVETLIMDAFTTCFMDRNYHTLMPKLKSVIIPSNSKYMIYYGSKLLFTDIKSGELMPHYRVKCDDDGNYTIEFLNLDTQGYSEKFDLLATKKLSVTRK